MKVMKRYRQASVKKAEHDPGDGKIVRPSCFGKYSVAQLVSGITPHNRHIETDWGARQGKES